MSTTTIRLPEDLKSRVAQVAERAGTTPHGFILDAIAEKAELEERRNDFNETADRRDAAIAAAGRTVAWADMRAYLQDRLAGKVGKRPVSGNPGKPTR